MYLDQHPRLTRGVTVCALRSRSPAVLTERAPCTFVSAPPNSIHFGSDSVFGGIEVVGAQNG